MAEISQLHVVLSQQKAGDRLALHDLILPGLQSHLVERSVAEGVIAEFKAGVDPHRQSFDPFVHLAEFVELLFIHKSHRWNLLFAENGQQP